MTIDEKDCAQYESDPTEPAPTTAPFLDEHDQAEIDAILKEVKEQGGPRASALFLEITRLQVETLKTLQVPGDVPDILKRGAAFETLRDSGYRVDRKEYQYLRDLYRRIFPPQFQVDTLEPNDPDFPTQKGLHPQTRFTMFTWNRQIRIFEYLGKAVERSGPRGVARGAVVAKQLIDLSDFAGTFLQINHYVRLLDPAVIREDSTAAAMVLTYTANMYHALETQGTTKKNLKAPGDFHKEGERWAHRPLKVKNMEAAIIYRPAGRKLNEIAGVVEEVEQEKGKETADMVQAKIGEILQAESLKLAQGVNLETVDVMRAIVSAWLNRAEHSTDLVPVKISELCDARGLAKHPAGGHRPENIRRMADQVEKLVWQHIRTTKVEAYTTGKGGKKIRGTVDHLTETPLFVIENREWWERHKTGEVLDYLFWIRPSADLAAYLRGHGRQIGYRPRGLLELDPYRHEAEKRILAELSHLWRVRAGKMTPLSGPFKIAALIKWAALDEKNPGEHPGRPAQRATEALDRLANKGGIKSWQFAPGCEGFDLEACRVLIEPPDEIVKANKDLLTRSPLPAFSEAPDGTPEAYTPQTLKAVREYLGMTQAQAVADILALAGGAVKISLIQYKRWEAGQAGPRQKIRDALTAWIIKHKPTVTAAEERRR